MLIKKNTLYIKFFSGKEMETNLGKIKNPDKVKQLILDTAKEIIAIEFIKKCISDAITSENCLCGSNICLRDKYCANDGSCLKKCISDAITTENCLCGSNICSRDKRCANDGSCLDLEKCGIDAITSKKCVCGSNTCQVNQYCTNDGNCLNKCGIDAITSKK